VEARLRAVEERLVSLGVQQLIVLARLANVGGNARRAA
jgi:hypothetical protein